MTRVTAARPRPGASASRRAASAAAPATTRAPRRPAAGARAQPAQFDPFDADNVLKACIGFGFLFWFAAFLGVSTDGKAMTLIGLILTGFAVMVALRQPRAYPALLVTYLPFNLEYPFILPGPPALNMTNIALGCGILAIVTLRSEDQLKFKFGPIEYVAIMYMVWGSANHLYSALRYPVVSPDIDWILQLKRWLGPMIFGFICRALIVDRRDVRRTLIALMMMIGLVGGLTIKQGREKARGSIDKSRVEGIMHQANSMGAFLVYYSTPAFAWFLVSAKPKEKAVALVAFGFAARSLLFTYSRGAYLSMTGGLVTMMMLRNPLYVVGCGVVGVGMVAFAPGLLPQSIVARLGHTSGNEDRAGAYQQGAYEGGAEAGLDQSAAQRVMLWRAGFKMIKEYPIMGVGLGWFGRRVHEYHELDLRAIARAGGHAPTDAHNHYILNAGELGIPALLMMVGLFAAVGLRGTLLFFARKDPIDRAVALGAIGSTLGLMASCMFGSRFSDEALMSNWWIIVMAMSAIQGMPEVKKAPAAGDEDALAAGGGAAGGRAAGGRALVARATARPGAARATARGGRGRRGGR